MASDTRFDSERMPSPNERRRDAETALARALDHSPLVEHLPTRDALHAFVAVLASEGLTPEATVIALKELLFEVRALHRFDHDARELLRSALVSECIAHYFAVRPADDLPEPRPTLTFTRVEGGGAPPRAPEAPAPDAHA